MGLLCVNIQPYTCCKCWVPNFGCFFGILNSFAALGCFVLVICCSTSWCRYGTEEIVEMIIILACTNVIEVVTCYWSGVDSVFLFLRVYRQWGYGNLWLVFVTCIIVGLVTLPVCLLTQPKMVTIFLKCWSCLWMW